MTLTLLLSSALAEDGVKLINSQIIEASGIAYSDSRGTLFVVEDEGNIFELNLDGLILRQNYLGDYDLEGVTFGLGGELILAVEDEESLLFVDTDSLSVIREISVDRKWNDKTVLKGDDSKGIEGIYSVDGRVFLLNQSNDTNQKKHSKNPSMLFEVKEDVETNEYYIYTVTYFPYPDLAGITMKDGLFYILSADEDLILVYDSAKNDVVKVMTNPIQGDQEGITFDTQGNMYIAVDGKGVFKTKLN